MDERVYDKLEKIEEKLQETNLTLAAQHISLKEHMRRTELLEEHIKPIQRHVIVVQGIVAFVLGLASLAGLFKLLG